MQTEIPLIQKAFNQIAFDQPRSVHDSDTDTLNTFAGKKTL